MTKTRRILPFSYRKKIIFLPKKKFEKHCQVLHKKSFIFFLWKSYMKSANKTLSTESAGFPEVG